MLHSMCMSEDVRKAGEITNEQLLAETETERENRTGGN